MMWSHRRRRKRRRTTNLTTKDLKGFWARSLKFTETVVVWVAILYLVNWLTSTVIIVWAIKETMNFSYLDTLITETSQTFRDVVGVAIIKFGVENIFKYNDFGGKIPSKTKQPEEVTPDDDLEFIDLNEGGIEG